jgi:hypothetical protein
MLTTLLVLALAVTALVLILLVLVVVGIQSEPPAAELSSRARNSIAAIARRLLGVYVNRPDPITTDADKQRRARLAGHTNAHDHEGW